MTTEKLKLPAIPPKRQKSFTHVLDSLLASLPDKPCINILIPGCGAAEEAQILIQWLETKKKQANIVGVDFGYDSTFTMQASERAKHLPNFTYVSEINIFSDDFVKNFNRPANGDWDLIIYRHPEIFPFERTSGRTALIQCPLSDKSVGIYVDVNLGFLHHFQQILPQLMSKRTSVLFSTYNFNEAAAIDTIVRKYYFGENSFEKATPILSSSSITEHSLLPSSAISNAARQDEFSDHYYFLWHHFNGLTKEVSNNLYFKLGYNAANQQIICEPCSPLISTEDYKRQVDASAAKSTPKSLPLSDFAAASSSSATLFKKNTPAPNPLASKLSPIFELVKIQVDCTNLSSTAELDKLSLCLRRVAAAAPTTDLHPYLTALLTTKLININEMNSKGDTALYLLCRRIDLDEDTKVTMALLLLSWGAITKVPGANPQKTSDCEHVLDMLDITEEVRATIPALIKQYGVGGFSLVDSCGSGLYEN